MKLSLLLLAVCPCSVADDAEDAALFAKKMTKVIQIISEHHFTPTSEGQLAVWSIRGLYETLKEPMPAEIARRVADLDKRQPTAIPQLLLDARRALKHRKELGAERDLQICVDAIALKLESGASRMTLIPPRDWIIELQPRPGDRSVGLKLECDPGGMLRVKTPILNGPAHKAGIRAGDIITHIRLDTDRDGKPFTEPDNEGRPAPKPQIYSTECMPLERAAELLRGKTGTRVTVSVVRPK